MCVCALHRSGASAAKPCGATQVQSTYVDLTPPPVTSLYDNADASVSSGALASHYIEIDSGDGQPTPSYVNADASVDGERRDSDYVSVSGPAPAYATVRTHATEQENPCRSLLHTTCNGTRKSMLDVYCIQSMSNSE